jgi:hypothetical protein
MEVEVERLPVLAVVCVHTCGRSFVRSVYFWGVPEIGGYQGVWGRRVPGLRWQRVIQAERGLR